MVTYGLIKGHIFEEKKFKLRWCFIEFIEKHWNCPSVRPSIISKISLVIRQKQHLVGAVATFSLDSIDLILTFDLSADVYLHTCSELNSVHVQVQVQSQDNSLVHAHFQYLLNECILMLFFFCSGIKQYSEASNSKLGNESNASTSQQARKSNAANFNSSSKGASASGDAKLPKWFKPFGKWLWKCDKNKTASISQWYILLLHFSSFEIKTKWFFFSHP